MIVEPSHQQRLSSRYIYAYYISTPHHVGKLSQDASADMIGVKNSRVVDVYTYSMHLASTYRNCDSVAAHIIMCIMYNNIGRVKYIYTYF